MTESGESLHEALHRHGYVTRKARHGRKDILTADRTVVLDGARADEAWSWLKALPHYEPLEVPPILVLLQNAWSPLYAGRRWPRMSWLMALKQSRSGKRLKHLGLPWGCYHNTTPIVGEKASSQVPIDRDHVAGLLETPGLQLVVGCGKQAAEAVLGHWEGPLLLVPHPAYRVVTNRLYQRAGGMIKRGIKGRYELIQDRRRIVKRKL